MDFQLVKIPNIFEPHKKSMAALPFLPGTTLRDVVRMAKFGDSVVVIHNRKIAEDLGVWIMPGDVIHLVPQVHEDGFRTVAMLALIVVVAMYAPGVGASLAGTLGGTAATWGTIFTFAAMTAGGMLINSMMPPPAATAGSGGNNSLGDSPTYGWGAGRNTNTEGLAIPVIYGNVATYPQVINFYKEITAAGYEWAHFLLCAAEGLAGNIPTEADIYTEGVALSSFDPGDYDLYATDGSNAPDTSQLVKFQKLHQFREFQKAVAAEAEANLLHFNGADASTTIVDEAVFTGTWECQGTADLSTANPWKGTASLDLTNAATDYLKYYNGEGYKNWDIFVVDTWDIEMRFRQPVLQDSGICGQHLDLSAQVSYAYNMYWGIVYDHANTRLVFQQYKEASGAYTVYFNITGTVTLSVDTWHHLRVCRSGDTVYLFLDGALVGSGAYATEPQEHGFTGYWYQGIGRAYWYDAAGPSHTLTYAQAEIDEFHFKSGALIYDELGSFTPADDETALIDLGINIETKGVVDEITFVINASQGLYWVSAADGSLNALSVAFNFEYRLKGTSAWTSNQGTISGNSRYPIKKQFNYSVTRGEYEVRVVRITPNFTGSSWAARTYWTALDEVLDEFLSHPNLQLVSVSLKAQDEFSGALPTIRITHNRDSIEVPNLSGSGTMSVDPTNNGYAAYDMLTSDLYGGGVDPTRFDADAWQDWIDWCNGLVDGNRRCQFNMIMDAQYSMDEALQHVENAGRAKITLRGTKISAVIEKPESHSGLFSSGNIKPGSAKLTILPQADRADAVEIGFKDRDNDWADNKVFWPGTGYETLSRVPKIVRMNIPGINNGEQAQREAIFRVQISEGIKRAISLESGIESITSTTGDVIRFAHEGNALAAGGRIAAIMDAGGIRIDKKITLDAATFSGNCKMWVRLSADDTIVEGSVSGPFDVETDIVYAGISGALRFDNYIVGRATDEKYLYRLVNMKRSGQKSVAITGLEYVESSYYHADYGGGAVAI